MISWWANGIAGLAANVISVAGQLLSSLVLPDLGTIIGIMTVHWQFLRRKYQKLWMSAKYFSHKIANNIYLFYCNVSTAAYLVA